MSWSQRATKQIWSSICMSNDGSIVFASVYGGNGGGIYKSIDSGETFVKTDLNVQYNFWNSVACSSTGEYVYACVSPTGSNNYGLWCSVNYGETWNIQYFLNIQCNAVSCSSDGSIVTVLTNTTVYIFKNYGDELTIVYPAGSGINKNWLSVSMNSSGSTILIGTFGGNVYISNDTGSNWVSKNPFNTNLIWNGVAVNSSGDILIIAPFNNNICISTDSGKNFTKLSLINNFKGIGCDSTGNFIVASALNDSVYTSSNAGFDWTQRTPTSGTQQYTCVSVSKDIDTETKIPVNIFASGNNLYLYQTTNGGVSCFIEGTNILIYDEIEKEEKIENLKIGDLIKTSSGDYKQIKHIGYNYIQFNKHPEYIRVMRKNTFKQNVPNKDLFVVSGHSFLFKNFNYANEYFTFNIYDNNIEPYYKIMAAHCSLCDQATSNDLCGKNMIKYYHFSLESENEDSQYGIYSNGMLSETMSISYFKQSGLLVKESISNLL
jgi:hypothetical protein